MSERAYQLIAAFCRSVDDGKRLLDAEPALINERTRLGETVLHYLTVENQLAAVSALVEDWQANINTLNDFGASPLSEATSLGYVELVKYLVSKGARLKVENQQDSVLHAAVRSNQLELVKIILEAGAEVNEVGDLDETALHIAAEDDNRAEIVKLLLDSGADPTATRIFDETPIAVAERSGSARVLSILHKALDII